MSASVSLLMIGAYDNLMRLGKWVRGRGGIGLSQVSWQRAQGKNHQSIKYQWEVAISF